MSRSIFFSPKRLSSSCELVPLPACRVRVAVRRVACAPLQPQVFASKRAVSISAFCGASFLFLSSFLPPHHLLSVLQRTMASPSSVARGAAARAPPPLDQLAAFYKTVDKRVTAGQLCRHARNAELSAQASTQAEALFGDDSLVVASLRFSESVSYSNLAYAVSGTESEALLRRSWAVLLSVVNLLQRRLAANTLLPGTIREEELDYAAHAQAATFKATNEPVPSQAKLRSWASTMGYDTLLHAMFRGLDLLTHPLWPTVQKRMVESFVLRGLDVIPRTAGIPADKILTKMILWRSSKRT